VLGILSNMYSGQMILKPMSKFCATDWLCGFEARERRATGLCLSPTIELADKQKSLNFM
jgi:hypothetical protein